MVKELLFFLRLALNADAVVAGAFGSKRQGGDAGSGGDVGSGCEQGGGYKRERAQT